MALKYIVNPQNITDALINIEFQLNNIYGWISVNDLESALIKAGVLQKATEDLKRLIENQIK